MRSTILLAVVAALSSACAEVNQLLDERKERRAQEYVDSAKVSCKRYGFKEGTDAFAKCIQDDVNAAKAREAIEEAANPVLRRSTTTSCTKTAVGLDCETR